MSPSPRQKIEPASLPQVALELIQLSTEPDCKFEAVVKTVSTDPAIAARILQVANSSIYEGQAPVSRLDHAVVRLGMLRTLGLALSFTLVKRESVSNAAYRARQELWLECVAQGMAAEWMAEQLRLPNSQASFVQGLLVDIGRLALWDQASSTYQMALEYQRQHGTTLIATERRHLGCDHVEVGLQLLKGAELPAEILDALAQHEQHEGPTPEPSLGLQCVIYANLLGKAVFSADVLTAQKNLMDWVEAAGPHIAEFASTGITAVMDRLHSDGTFYFADTSLLPSNAQLVATAEVLQQALASA